jgi:hypothetical protein
MTDRLIRLTTALAVLMAVSAHGGHLLPVLGHHGVRVAA